VFITPLMLYELLDHPDIDKRDLSSMVVLSVGTAATNPVRLRQAVDRFGAVVRITYGLSESPFISAYPGVGTDPDRIGSCGPAYGDVRLQIRGEDGHTVLRAGETGELWVASKLNFGGYVGSPEQTAATLVDGWVRTGDLGMIDGHGRVAVRGRIKDQINRGGEKISPEHVEEVLLAHPGVTQAAVFGVSDALYGERVGAIVVPRRSSHLDAAALTGYCRQRLTTFEIPEQITFADRLPLTAKGSVDRTKLAALGADR
jgi:fatty-acyl-CoA synthase